MLGFPVESLYYTVFIFVISLFTIRKILYSFYDPLILAIYSLCSSIGLMLYYYYETNVNISNTIVVSFICCHIFFLLGLLLPSKVKLKFRYQHGAKSNYDFLKLFLVVTLVLLTIVYMTMAKSIGLAVFADDPELAKTAIYQGSGIFKRILPGLIFLAFSLLFILRQLNMSKKKFACIFIYLGLLNLSLGSKGWLVLVLFIYSYYQIFLMNTKQNTENKTNRNFGIIVFLLLATSGAILVMMVNISNQTGYALSDVIDIALSAFLNRVVAFGDISYYYFYHDLTHSFVKTPIEYIDYLLGDLLGMLRLSDHHLPLGAEMAAEAWNFKNEDSVGPNGQLYFVSFIFFGPILGSMYSLIFGVFIAFIRKVSFEVFNKTHLDAIIFISLNYFVNNFPVDLPLNFVSLLCNMVVIMLIYYLTKFIYQIVRRNKGARGVVH